MITHTGSPMVIEHWLMRKATQTLVRSSQKQIDNRNSHSAIASAQETFRRLKVKP